MNLFHPGKNIDLPQRQQVNREAHIMKTFDHDNVLPLKGLCFDKYGVPMIVMPFMGNGSIESYIREPMRCFDLKLYLRFAREVAQGNFPTMCILVNNFHC